MVLLRSVEFSYMLLAYCKGAVVMLHVGGSEPAGPWGWLTGNVRAKPFVRQGSWQGRPPVPSVP